MERHSHSREGSRLKNSTTDGKDHKLPVPTGVYLGGVTSRDTFTVSVGLRGRPLHTRLLKTSWEEGFEDPGSHQRHYDPGVTEVCCDIVTTTQKYVVTRPLPHVRVDGSVGKE